MARGRVVVPDLAAPERIQPTPIQRDLYTKPAQPPINNDLERLEQALGHFNTNLQAYGRAQEADAARLKAAQDKALKEQYEGDIYKWKSQTTSADRWQAYQSGTAPHQDDIIAEEATKKLWAQSAGDQMGADIDGDLAANKLPLDQEDFNPERYVLGKAKPYLDQMNGRPDLMKYFAEEVDGAQKSVRSRYQTVLGEARKARVEKLASNQLEDAFDDAMEDGLSGEEAMSYMREKYVGLGPRAGGGSLDLGYDKLDELTLNMLKEKAKDPAVAEKVIHALDADRSTLDGTGTSIGAISSVNKHNPAVNEIRTTALNTLATQFDTDYQKDLLDKNVAKFGAQDGSFSTIISDQKLNPYNQKETEVSADKQKEAAAIAWMRQYRQSPDYDPKKEVLTFMNNNVKHPEFFNTLEDTFSGIGNTNLGTKGNVTPDQLQKVMDAGNLYETLANSNYAYTDKHLSEKAREFYEAYHYLLRYNTSPNAPGQSAAAQVVRAFSSEENKNPDLMREQNENIASAVQNLGRAWFFSANPENPQELFNKAQNLTKILVRVNGGDVNKAAEAAVERLKESGVNINGRFVTGFSGIMPGDEQNVQRILDAQFNAHKDELRALGASDSSDLTVLPMRDGSAQVYIAGVGPAVVKDGDTYKVITFTPSDVQKLRTAEEDLKRAKALQATQQKRAGYPGLKKGLDQYAPFNGGL